MPGKLYFTVGLPRSGKTTLANKWVEDGPKRLVFSGDTFRLAIHGLPYIKEAEGLVFSIMDVAARAMLLDGYDVLMDETASTEATILRYLNLDIDAQPMFVHTPASVCKERAVAGNRPYLVPVIDRIDKQLFQLLSRWDATFERLKDHVRGQVATNHRPTPHIIGPHQPKATWVEHRDENSIC